MAAFIFRDADANERAIREYNSFVIKILRDVPEYDMKLRDVYTLVNSANIGLNDWRLDKAVEALSMKFRADPTAIDKDHGHPTLFKKYGEHRICLLQFDRFLKFVKDKHTREDAVKAWTKGYVAPAATQYGNPGDVLIVAMNCQNDHERERLDRALSTLHEEPKRPIRFTRPNEQAKPVEERPWRVGRRPAIFNSRKEHR